MTHEALDINGPSSPKLGFGLKELVTSGQNTLFLQEALVVVLVGAAPKGIDLKKRIAGFAIGVFGIQSLRITSGLSIEQEVNGVPLGWRKILHRQVVPLRTQ